MNNLDFSVYDIVRNISILFLLIYSSFFDPVLPDQIITLFNNKLFIVAIILFVLYLIIYIKDVPLAILIIVVFYKILLKTEEIEIYDKYKENLNNVSNTISSSSVKIPNKTQQTSIKIPNKTQQISKKK